MVKLRRVESVEYTRKDASKVKSALEEYFNEDKNTISFDNESQKDLFLILGGFTYNGKDYKIQIYEKSDDSKNRICVEIKTWGDTVVDKEEGVSVTPSKVVSSLRRLLKVNDIDYTECKPTNKYNQWKDRVFKNPHSFIMLPPMFPYRPPHVEPFPPTPRPPKSEPSSPSQPSSPSDIGSTTIGSSTPEG